MPENASLDSYQTRASLNAGGATHTIYRLDVAAQKLGLNLRDYLEVIPKSGYRISAEA